MQLIKNKNNLLVFNEEMDESLANAIRRYVSEVPVIAVDEVEIFKNDSPLYDETIAHRIGLIPLKTEKGVGDKSKIQLKLSVNKEGIIYSGDLKGNADVVYGEIPITLLDKDQEIELVATAKLGTGNEHAKFMPGLVYYKNMKEIKTGSKSKEISEIFSGCNNNCGKDKKLENNKTYVLDICDSCEYELENLKIEMNDTKNLVISIESFGQIGVKDIFSSAIKELKKDLAEVGKKI